MRGLRLVGRGLSDTFEHLLPFCLATVCWWALVAVPVGAFFVLGSVAAPLSLLALPLLAPVPAATAALFLVADPRRATGRPDWGEVVAFGRHVFGRAGKLALVTLPPTAILAWNLFYYGARTEVFAWLVPVWLMLFLVGLAVTLGAFAALGLLDCSVSGALRRAAYAAGSAPFRMFFLLVVFGLYALLGAGLVVPGLLFVPALIAATLNRFVLNQLQIPIPDPLAPTPERLHEEQARKAAKVRG